MKIAKLPACWQGRKIKNYKTTLIIAMIAIVGFGMWAYIARAATAMISDI